VILRVHSIPRRTHRLEAFVAVDDFDFHESLGAVAGIVGDPDFHFESARPPLLRDFFDPMRKLLPIRPRMRTIEVNFEIKDYLVAE
jgi:hypothetical protein